MKGRLEELKDSIVDYLAADIRLTGTKVMGAFPPESRGYPVKSPLMVVGLHSVELAPGGMGGYLGEGTQGALYGKTAGVTVFFDIHCPPASGGDACHRLYEALCDVLLLEQTPFGFVKLWCDGIQPDKSSYSNRLRACATMQAAVTVADVSLKIREFQVRSEPLEDDQ